MALSGVSYQTRRGAARKRQIGFAGIQIEIPGALPISVRDRRGRGLAGATVTIHNPTDESPFTTTTDGQGNALVQKDASNPNPVTVVKDRVVTEVNYTTEASLTVVVDMMKNKPQI